MGQFIEQVQRINQDNNHKYRITEERENVKNALFKRILEEFRKVGAPGIEDYEGIYSELAKIDTMQQICCHDFDFGTHVKLEYVYTTYQKELDKVYKMFKKQQKTELAKDKLDEERMLEQEKEEQERREKRSSLMLVMDKRERMKPKETYEQHEKNATCVLVETKGDYTIKHYNINGRNKELYDFRIYYINGKMDIDETTRELRKDGILKGIKVKPYIKIFPDILWMLPCILLLCYLGFYVILVLLVLLFLFIIILTN